jgi:hypothetical protein
MSALAPGHVLVLLSKVPETQVVVDLGKCLRFVVHPPYNRRRALDPGIPWRPIPKIFRLSPDGLWFEEGGHEFEIGKVFYVERHPVHITHHFLIMNKPLPSKLAPYRDQATGENYFKWRNQQAIKPDESCSDSITTQKKPGAKARAKIVEFFNNNPKPEWKLLEEIRLGVGSTSDRVTRNRLNELVREGKMEPRKGQGLWRLRTSTVLVPC